MSQVQPMQDTIPKINNWKTDQAE